MLTHQQEGVLHDCAMRRRIFLFHDVTAAIAAALHEVRKLRIDNEELKRDNVALTQIREMSRNDLAAALQERATLAERLDVAEQENHDLAEQLDKAHEDLNEGHEVLTKLRAEIHELSIEMTPAETALAAIRSAIQQYLETTKLDESANV